MYLLGNEKVGKFISEITHERLVTMRYYHGSSDGKFENLEINYGNVIFDLTYNHDRDYFNSSVMFAYNKEIIQEILQDENIDTEKYEASTPSLKIIKIGGKYEFELRIIIHEKVNDTIPFYGDDYKVIYRIIDSGTYFAEKIMEFKLNSGLKFN